MLAQYEGIRPAVHARCTSAADVTAALARARADGLSVAVRSGGHCFAGRSSTEGLLLDLAPLRGVALEGDLVTVGAGTPLAAVYDALDPHGVTLPAGCGPTVGVSGLVLGGGLGVLGRQFGLTSDRLREAEVVLADGRVMTCDEEREPDLFWALRGSGGARVGVVTRLVLQVVPAADATAFRLAFPVERAAELIVAWQAWEQPPALAASLLVHADHVLSIGSMSASEAETRAALAPLGEPVTAEYASGAFRAAKRFLSGLGHGEDEPLPLHNRSEFFRDVWPPETAAELVEGLPPGAELDMSPWGGAYGRVAPEATAFAHRDPRYLVKFGIAGRRAWIDAAWELAHPFGTGGVYPNFPEPDLDPWSPEHLGVNRERMLAVRAAYA
jgi:FAD/FMN-containing dehydrogenase